MYHVKRVVYSLDSQALQGRSLKGEDKQLNPKGPIGIVAAETVTSLFYYLFYTHTSSSPLKPGDSQALCGINTERIVSITLLTCFCTDTLRCMKRNIFLCFPANVKLRNTIQSFHPLSLIC